MVDDSKLFFWWFIAFPLAIPQGAFLVHHVPNGRARNSDWEYNEPKRLQFSWCNTMNIHMGTKNQSHPSSPSVQVTFHLGCHLHSPSKPHLELELSDQFLFAF
jgi:hypothetical protein